MKMISLGVKHFYADGQTDRQTDIHNEANSPFRNFANSTNNSLSDVNEVREAEKSLICILYTIKSAVLNCGC
jgi:hypothetical protein